MKFHSILFKNAKDSIKEDTIQMPDFFNDLNLDQIIDSIIKGKEDYNLKPFFFTYLNDLDSIYYRQEIMQDLENQFLFKSIELFAKKMKEMHRYIALIDKLDNKYHKQGWFLEVADIYCKAVNCLAHDLYVAELKSHGFLAFREYIVNYSKYEDFILFMAKTKKLKADLSTVKYCVLINGDNVKVQRYNSEIDYSIVVEETFEKFKQNAVKDYRVKLYEGSGMNHVEAEILNRVAKLYSDIFLNLDQYSIEYSSFLDETINNFDREIQFYIAYLEFIESFKQNGLKFCHPQISNQSKEVYAYEGFDLALANKLINEKTSIVCNDFFLKDRERIFVVSGLNQGGKTTFARTFGQMHYLASLGLTVPAREARLFLFDKIFTHFEKEEDIKNLRGKLQDDLIRIYDILSHATSNNIIIMNEIFTSTTLQDAVFLSKKIMEKIMELDLLCVWVTFIVELLSLSEKTVSMTSTVSPENPALRTYKIVRKPADGLAYALSIAEKYRLTYDFLKERIKS